MTGDGGGRPPKVSYNPWLPELRRDPYPVYRALREADPVQFNPFAGIWFLSRHAECAAILRDGRFSAALGQGIRMREQGLPRSMLTADPPEHTRLRDPVKTLFAPRTLAPLRGRVRAHVNALLGALEGRERADLMADLATPLPLRILAELIGVPAAGLARFARAAQAAAVNLDPLAAAGDQRRGIAAAEELRGCLAAALDAPPRADGGDAIGRLVRTEERRGVLSRDELLTTCSLFVVGGHEPMANLVGNGLLALLRHPGELGRLRASDDPALLRSAVEELLRYDSPIQFAARVGTADVALDGATIRAGQAVVALIGAANRDPAVFGEPDRLDLARRPNPHLAYGAGAHFCLGAPLARLAGAVAIDAVIRRFPRLALAGAEPEWRASHVPRGLRALPVRL